MNKTVWKDILADFCVNFSAGTAFTGSAVFVAASGSPNEKLGSLLVYTGLSIVFLILSYYIKVDKGN